jgi:hypothetical protein
MSFLFILYDYEDSPNTIKKEGWGKGEISELFRILSQTLCFLKSHVLVTAFLVPGRYIS